MLFITQLIFVKKGKEVSFLEFESFVIPLMEKYKGKIVYRIRPTKDNFIDESKELPYEIHIISFDSKQDLDNYRKDNSRKKFIHLKEASVISTISIMGEKM